MSRGWHLRKLVETSQTSVFPNRVYQIFTGLLTNSPCFALGLASNLITS